MCPRDLQSSTVSRRCPQHWQRAQKFWHLLQASTVIEVTEVVGVVGAVVAVLIAKRPLLSNSFRKLMAQLVDFHHFFREQNAGEK